MLGKDDTQSTPIRYSRKNGRYTTVCIWKPLKLRTFRSFEAFSVRINVNASELVQIYFELLVYFAVTGLPHHSISSFERLGYSRFPFSSFIFFWQFVMIESREKYFEASGHRGVFVYVSEQWLWVIIA